MPTYFKFTHLLFENVYIVSVIKYFDYLKIILIFFLHWNPKNSNTTYKKNYFLMQSIV
jgi:hypothetical protein